MTNPSMFEGVVLVLLAKVDQEIESLRRNYDLQLAKLQAEREALAMVINSYKTRMADAVTSESVGTLSAEEVRGKSYPVLLELIARKNGGVLITNEAIRLICDTGRFDDMATVEANVRTAVRRMRGRGKLEQVGPGVYRLLERRLPEPKKEQLSVFDTWR